MTLWGALYPILVFNLMCPLPIFELLGDVLGGVFIYTLYISNFNRTACNQTEKPWIWVSTVCLCLLKRGQMGTPKLIKQESKACLRSPRLIEQEE